MRFDIEQIDRGILARFQTVLAQKGYWPNVNDYSDLDDSGQQAAFQAEKATIRTTLSATGKKLIEPFAVGNEADRLEKTDCHLTVRRNEISAGTVGFGSSIEIVPVIVDNDNPENNTFQEVQRQDHLYNIEYEIRFRTNSLVSHRQADEVIMKALSIRKNIKGKNSDYTDTVSGFEIRVSGEPTEIKSPDYIERMYRYEVLNVEIDEPDVITADIVATTQINVEIQVLEDDMLVGGATLPTYAGSLILANINETNIKTLNETIRNKGDHFSVLFSPTVQRFVYAYPKSFGLLSDIKDSECDSIINGFIQVEDTFTISGNPVDYYIYYLNGDTTQIDYALDFLF